MLRALVMRSLPILPLAFCLFLAGDRSIPTVAEPLRPEPLVLDREASAEALEQALEKRVNIDADETPLFVVVKSLADQARIPIYIDDKALKDVGIDCQTPITLKLQKVTLKNILERMLREVDLTWTIRHDAVIVTTPEEANARLRVTAYRVVDLVGPAGRPFGLGSTKSLIDLLKSVVSPHCWDTVGGPARVTPLGQALVVSATDETHRKVAQFLDSLRKSKASYDAWNGKDRNLPHSPGELGWYSKGLLDPIWEKARRRGVTFTFDETPLDLALFGIAQKSGLSFAIDIKALKDVGIDPQTPVTFQCRDLPLEGALELMLNDLDLTHVFRNETLWITTPEEANAKLAIHVFPVYDLVAGNIPAELANVRPGWGSPSELEDMVRDTVAATTWDIVGGPGSVHYFAPAGALVVSNTPDVIVEIPSLLRKLRRAAPIAPKLSAADWEKERITRVYGPFAAPVAAAPQPAQGNGFGCNFGAFMGGGGQQAPGRASFAIKASDLATIIKATIEPASWNRPAAEVSINVTGDQIVIRHSVAVHDRIERMILALAAQKSALPANLASPNWPILDDDSLPRTEPTPESAPAKESSAAKGTQP